jgi:spermidine synthase
MKKFLSLLLLPVALLVTPGSAAAAVVFETTTAHHHIRVLDQGAMRILSFNGSQETRMMLNNPLQGHFEYTEFFHMPWLWNTNITNVLMIGLGGGSSQRSYLHYYPGVQLDTVEIDPTVRVVAQRFFNLPETNRHRIVLEDGRMFLRRSRETYDAILLDAYRTTRYGSFIPYHMATKEFFEIAKERLSTNGVVAFNVIGTEAGWRADILGATYRTMKTVFPQVYQFPARDSLNVVLIATKADEAVTDLEIRRRAGALITSKTVTLPTFMTRAAAFRQQPPRTVGRSPVLTDDFAPVDGLLTEAKQ